MKNIKLIWQFLAVVILCTSFNACSKDEDNEKETQTIDGYGFVDLGLSVKWASSNLSGYYQYGNPTSNSFKSENALPTYGVGGTSSDPAFVGMSSKWRLPTRTEMEELVDKCSWKLITEKGTRYFRVTGPSGKSITLPCSGAYPLGNNSSLLYENYQCWLMTSTLNSDGNPRPYILKASYINESSQPTVTVTTNEALRISGMSVRGVSTAAPDVVKNGNGGDDEPALPYIPADDTDDNNEVTRDALIHGTWLYFESKDVTDEQGFAIGTRSDWHYLHFEENGSGWERYLGDISANGKTDHYDTGKEDFTFKYKSSTRELIITRNGESRTIIVSRKSDYPYRSEYGTWMYLDFDGMMYSNHGDI